MSKTLLLLVLVAFLSNVKYGSSSRDTFPEGVVSWPYGPGISSSPHYDTLPARNSILNTPSILTNEQHLNANFNGRQYDWPSWVPPFTNPWDFINQAQVLTGAVLNAIAAQFNKDLDLIRIRQDDVIKFIEGSCAKTQNCKQVPKMDANLLRSSSYMSAPEEVVTSDKLLEVVNTLRVTMEQVNLRQNTLFEYMSCACDVTSLRPVLDVMFANHRGDPTIRPDRANPLNSLFSGLISQFPYNFSNWFGYNFNPLNTIFGGLFGFPFNIFGPTPKPPSYWGVFKPPYPGYQGVYNSVSTSSGPTGTYASTYGYGHPSGAGSTYYSATSTSTPQGTSVTTNGRPGENYVVQHPGGGSTQVSTSGDGSSIAVSSTSGR